MVRTYDDDRTFIERRNMTDLNKKLGIKAKGIWKKEQMIIKLKDSPDSRRAIELANTDGTEMRVRSIKIAKFFRENNKFAIELERFVPAK